MYMLLFGRHKQPNLKIIVEFRLCKLKFLVVGSYFNFFFLMVIIIFSLVFLRNSADYFSFSKFVLQAMLLGDHCRFLGPVWCYAMVSLFPSLSVCALCCYSPDDFLPHFDNLSLSAECSLFLSL